jgi:hypothetical protein
MNLDGNLDFFWLVADLLPGSCAMGIFSHFFKSQCWRGWRRMRQVTFIMAKDDGAPGEGWLREEPSLPTFIVQLGYTE